MLVLYRTADCPSCSRVEDILDDLAIAYEKVVGTVSELRAQLPDGARPPALIDDGEVFEGRDAILEHLEELQGFVEAWRKYQSDACYCDEE